MAQAAFSTVLLVGAGLLVRSLDRAQGLDLGLDADQVLMAQPVTERGALSRDERAVLYGRATERLGALSGVVAAAGVWARARRRAHPG